MRKTNKEFKQNFSIDRVIKKKYQYNVLPFIIFLYMISVYLLYSFIMHTLCIINSIY